MNLRQTTSLLAASAALALLLGTAWAVRSQAPGRVSDFAAFYAAGRLIGTGQLYDARQLQRIEKESTGRGSPAHGFVRPPFHALLFWPLAQLRYDAAEVAWAGIAGLALVGFVWLWPGLEWSQRWVLACISLPAAIGLANGQDAALILLTVTAAVTLYNRDRRFTAGMLFSLCAAKAHLFLLLPLLIIRRREYRFGGGLLGGGLALAAISTIAEGWNWPVRMWDAATHPAFTPAARLMPNLAGALDGVPAAGWIGAAVAAILAAVSWTALAHPRAAFHSALAVSIAASLPLAPHSYLADCALVLPAICVSLAQRDLRTTLMAYLLATPIPYLAVFLDWPYSGLTTVALVVFAAMTGKSLPAAT